MGLAWIQWGVLLGVFLTAVGAGCATRKADLEHAQELSGAVAVCLFVQYLVRPLIGFALCAAFDVPDLVAIGVLLCCCAPGGSGASLHLMLTGGDAALGSACTTISSVASLGGVPLVFALYFQRFAESGFATPWDDIFLVIAIVVVGVLAGVGVRRHYERAGRQLEEASSAVGAVLLVALLSVSVFDNVSIFSDIPSSALFVGATVAPCCVFFGSATNRIAGLDPRAARTIAIETAECNVGFAYAIMLLAWRCAPADRGERTDACEAGDAVFTGVISFTIFNQIAIWVLTAGWLMEPRVSSFVERQRSTRRLFLAADDAAAKEKHVATAAAAGVVGAHRCAEREELKDAERGELPPPHDDFDAPFASARTPIARAVKPTAAATAPQPRAGAENAHAEFPLAAARPRVAGGSTGPREGAPRVGDAESADDAPVMPCVCLAIEC